jgi:hypothetical protein
MLRLLTASCLLLQGAPQDLGSVLERADALFAEARAAYEEARAQSKVDAFVDAGFKLEEARIKYLVLQEIGQGDLQKTAADRLRAVNQLTKLIHDGKVAVMAPPAAPAATAPAADPAAPAPPTALAADVTRRVPVPDAAKQKEAEKQVRDLFKDQYSKKTQADRRALARALLQQAAKSQDDPLAFWVLCREAQDVAAQACDPKTALDALDAAAGLIDCDVLALKTAAMTAAGRAAKTPADSVEVAEASLRLVDDLAAVDQYDVADKTVSAALSHAKRAAEPDLAARVALRSKEIAESKTLFQGMKGSLQTQAKNPDDPGANLEIGRFLCFAKGSWDLGLRFLVKGSDASLKAIAQKELAFPQPADERAALADGWYELAQKERSPLRKSRLLAHAREVYESALAAEAPALLRARVEKRLEALDGTGGGSTAAMDLISLIDPNADAVQGTWKLTNQKKTLVSPEGGFCRVQIRYAPPEEYDLKITAERKSGSSDFYLGLSRGENLMAIAFDADAGTRTYLGATGVSYMGRVFPDNQPATLLVAVRKKDLTVTLNDKKILTYAWKGDEKRQAFQEGWEIQNKRAMILGTHGSSFLVTRMLLTPVTGAGRKLP